jgi:hypothetical protein
MQENPKKTCNNFTTCKTFYMTTPKVDSYASKQLTFVEKAVVETSDSRKMYHKYTDELT